MDYLHKFLFFFGSQCLVHVSTFSQMFSLDSNISVFEIRFELYLKKIVNSYEMIITHSSNKSILTFKLCSAHYNRAIWQNQCTNAHIYLILWKALLCK